MDLKWRRFFGDPSQWFDYRGIKFSSRFPDFKHKETHESLWIDGWHNPPWVRQELKRRGLLQSSSQVCPAQDTYVHGKLFKEEAGSSLFLVASLKNCARKKDLCEGTRLDTHIRTHGLLVGNPYLGSSLISMYAKCNALSKAQEVFHELPVRGISTWNALLSAYAQQGLGKEVLDYFFKMRSEGLAPDPFTYACTLKACGMTQEIDLGEQIHNDIVCQGLLGKDTVLGNALVDMYVKCGALAKAQEVLDELPVRDVVSWTSLMAGYAQQEDSEKAIICYDEMQRQGLSPNARTYACILKAYGIAKEVDKGKEIHEEISNEGLLGTDLVLGNALVDMYAKCGMLPKAQQVLEELPVRDVVSWNALMTGYAQEGQGEEAKDCFERMRSEGLAPDIVSWNTLIGGYAQQGAGDKALSCFRSMYQEGISPRATTLICVLNACSHSGLVNEGEMFFKSMEKKFGITPDIEHHACMVDLFGRTGDFDKALAVIEKLCLSTYLAVWLAVLGACGKWGNVEVGRLAFGHAVQINEHDAAAYVLMESIYTAAGMGDEAQEVELMRVKNATHKLPGWIGLVDETSGINYSFIVSMPKGDSSRQS